MSYNVLIKTVGSEKKFLALFGNKRYFDEWFTGEVSKQYEIEKRDIPDAVVVRMFNHEDASIWLGTGSVARFVRGKKMSDFMITFD